MSVITHCPTTHREVGRHFCDSSYDEENQNTEDHVGQEDEQGTASGKSTSASYEQTSSCVVLDVFFVVALGETDQWFLPMQSFEHGEL